MSMSDFANKMVKGHRIIYTASAFARDNLIFLQEIGESEYIESYESVRGKMDSYLFFIVKKGGGRIVFYNTEYEINEGECVFLDCNQRCSISCDERLWTLEWIHFNGIVMPQVYDKFLERCGAPCFKPEDHRKLEKLLGNIYKEANKYSYVQDMVIMSRISDLLTEIMQQCWRDNSSIDNNLSIKRWIEVRKYLDENYNKNINLDTLSTEFYINKFYLARKFKEAYGYTINTYITNLRINHAKELLRFTDYSITEVALQVGYGDPAYFTRIFKMSEGKTPRSFRRQWKLDVKSI